MRTPRAYTVVAVTALSACTSLDGFSGGQGGADAAGADAGADVGGLDVVDALEAGHETGADTSTDAPAGDAATGYVATILSDNPVAYWRLDEASGTVAADLSGHAKSATYTNTTLGVAGALLNDPDHAARFDGNTSYVAGPNFAFAGLVPFSIEAWANIAPSNQNYQTILGNELASGVREGYSIFITPANLLSFERIVSNTHNVATGPLFASTQFHHVVGTYDGSTLLLYLDGAEVASASDTRSMAGSPDPFCTSSLQGLGEFFDGVIDEVAIYDHVLSAARVAAHYHASGR
jgi:hypothetical protein